jgi:predicted ATPase
MAVAAYLQAVAGEVGTLLILDDLQWTGQDALDLLAALISATGHRPGAGHPRGTLLRVIGAYRDTDAASGPMSSLVADLAGGSLVHVLALDALSDDEAAQLLSRLLTERDEARRALLSGIVRRADGIPFYLVSYAEDVRHRGEEEALLEPPWTVTQVVRQRVVALSDAAREVCGVAVIAGRAVTPSLLV